MHYLALGDSISIDAYTGLPGGGAASQLASRVRASPFQDLTRDGNTTHGVLRDLERVQGRPDLITLTVGGNNLLMHETAGEIVPLIDRIGGELERYGAQVILATVYDPTDGDDSLAEATGLSRHLRQEHRAVNAGIREIAARRGFLFSDLEALFHGHGLRAEETWYTLVIEPNLAGATAIAAHWHELVSGEG